MAIIDAKLQAGLGVRVLRLRVGLESNLGT